VALRNYLERLKDRLASSPDGLDDERAPWRRPSRHGVDGNTRTFWSEGADAPSTLIEVEGSSSTPKRAVTELLEKQSQTASRPRSNPVFNEATFVELMRARRFKRAYDLLAPDCQRAWGSWMAFADANRGDMSNLRGVEVTDSQILDDWVDEARGVTHRNVAELKVEYQFGRGDTTDVIEQTVHLVGIDGKWCSLSYPPKR
jgi:hypothetical protein